MPIIEIALIQVRRGQEYQTGVPQLQPGEMAWAEDTENLYIGKRIVEGASNNNNSRILTDKDLNKIFQIAQASVAQANSSTAYRYRGDIPYGDQPGQLMSTTSTYANKLNNWVSLTDFNPVWPPFEGNNITTILQNAIGIIASNNISSGVIFQNGTGVGPVPILIPAGNWTIDSTVSLPPYTTLIGDGMGMTVLTYTGSEDTSNPMFQTVDSNGLSFTEDMAVGNGQHARFIKLQKMTLQFPGDFDSTATLVSLDNVQDVYIEEVYIGNTSTSVLTGTGTGIRIRTSGTAPSDLTMSPSNNINFNHCVFNGVTTAIDNQGTVNKIVIKDNEFNWLDRGIKSANTTTLAGFNIVIDNNKFQNIANEAILIGTDINPVRSYVVSCNNSFREVGCNFLGESNQNSNVIKFNDYGCQSINDFFDRQVSTPDGIYMYPWVSDNASVSSGATYQVVIPSLVTVTVIRIPLAKNNQMATINYVLTNDDMHRTGQLNLNISTVADDGYSSVSDSFNYMEDDTKLGASDLLVFSTRMFWAIPRGDYFRNHIELICVNDSQLETTLEYTINLIN